MADEFKKYRLNSVEEPTDEMLFALMEGIAAAARQSSEKAEIEKRRRLRAVADEIQYWRNQQHI